MKSKKKLFEFFKAKYGKILDLKSKGISDETYGPKSFVYVYDALATLGVSRAQVIKDLVSEGFPKPGQWGMHKDWNKHDCEGQGVEIRVSYFKGQRWWE